MRTVRTEDIIKNIKEMCIEANHFLSEDMRQVFEQSVEAEKSPLGSLVLNQLKENLEIAGKDMIPICQDTGMAVVFMKVGQDVHIEGGSLTDAVNEGVRQGYYSSSERIRKREYEPRIYAEACRRHRGRQGGYSHSSQGRGAERLPSYGNRSGDRRNV